MYISAFTPVKLSEQGFATEADRAYYTSFDTNKDGIISFAEQQNFLQEQGLPLMPLPVPTPASTQSGGGLPILPIALLAYFFMS
ncbi:MAG: hypothetical protein EB116_10790 [Betaproteobacteria bacterium]|nr:hypothetical protein [Betaproteobacteria bacterium]